MKTRMRMPRSIALVLALALTDSLATTLLAQTTPAPSATAEEAPVVLNAFTIDVERDRGYIAVDALAGGRTNTPVRLTPAAISSLTRTFINDLGIQNVREALRWTPNVVPTDLNAGKGFGGSAFHEWSFNYRSAGAGQQGGPGPTRNYFSFYQNADSYNIERIEFTRGPNSILFGLGTVGGTLSTYTKVPRVDKDFIEPAVIVDNHGSVRFEGDFNRRLSNKVALRINALYDENRGWRENDENEKQAVDLALLYQPTSNTSLRLELEGSKSEKTLISSTIGDKISGWDGTTASATWGAAPTGGARTTKIQNAGAWGDWLNPFWVYIPSLGSKSLMGWAGGYASTNSLEDTGQALNFQPRAGWYPAEIKLPWETTYSSTARVPIRASDEWTYGHGISKIDYENITAFWDQKFTENIDTSVAFYRYTDEQTAKDYEGTGGAAIDINRQLPDGSPNPNYGKAFADFFLSKQTQSRTNTEARAQLNYHFDATLFGTQWKQLFSASVARRELTISARQYLAQVGNSNIANPADWVHNMVWGRIYLDNPNQMMNPPEVAPNGRQISYMPKADGYWFDFDDKFELDDFALVSHSRLLNDNLSILLGARRDEYNERLVELRRGPGLTDRISNESDSGTTYSAGVVYYFFKGLGAFVNYSKNIQPPPAGSQPMLNGARPGPEEGEGLEYGFRISTPDGKYYASILRYDSESVGHLVENPIGFRDIWDRYYKALGTTADTNRTNLAYSDITSRDVNGYEIDLTANPTPNLRLQASYAKPEAEVIDFYPHSRTYFAANLATWNAAPATTELRSEIAKVQDKLAQSLPGTSQEKAVDYTASFFAHYAFTNDTLKGFSVGGGASFIGKSYAATYDNRAYYGDSFMNTSAVIAYETSFRKVRMRFALNVENVLDEDDPIVTSYHWGLADRSGTHIRDAYLLREPRTFRLTARFTF